MGQTDESKQQTLPILVDPAVLGETATKHTLIDLHVARVLYALGTDHAIELNVSLLLVTLLDLLLAHCPEACEFLVLGYVVTASAWNHVVSSSQVDLADAGVASVDRWWVGDPVVTDSLDSNPAYLLLRRLALAAQVSSFLMALSRSA